MSSEIMRGGQRPEIRRLAAGDTLTRQGEPGDELFLVLDGVLSVDVDGRELAQVGPGAVLGERALLEGGRRTSTLTAVTPVRVAVAAKHQIDVDRLTELSGGHRREEAVVTAE
jgi:CRP-like cAMP-binding protein